MGWPKLHETERGATVWRIFWDAGFLPRPVDASFGMGTLSGSKMTKVPTYLLGYVPQIMCCSESFCFTCIGFKVPCCLLCPGSGKYRLFLLRLKHHFFFRTKRQSFNLRKRHRDATTSGVSCFGQRRQGKRASHCQSMLLRSA